MSVRERASHLSNGGPKKTGREKTYTALGQAQKKCFQTAAQLGGTPAKAGIACKVYAGRKVYQKVQSQALK